jgi:lactate permease
MPWAQGYDPLGSLPLSALFAAAPLVVLFGLMAWGKLPGWVPALAALAASLSIAAAGWGMPPVPAVAAALGGAAYALLPILWIVFSALWVHSLCVESGQFEVLKRTLSRITDDRRLQVLFIAFAFGAFLEGAAGFGTPVAITAAMLVGFGFEGRIAAVLCLIANSSPVAFAAAGVPVAAAAGVSGLDVVTLGRIVGGQVSILSLIVPFWLCVALAGWRRSFEVLPAIAVAGVLLSATQFLITRYSGPWTAGIVSGLVAMGGLWIFLRLWKPRSNWDLPGAHGPGAHGPGVRGPTPAPAAGGLEKVPPFSVLRAWGPYLIMSVMVLLWSAPWLKEILGRLDPLVPWPWLHGAILKSSPLVPSPTPYPAIFSLAIASGPGTAIFLAGLISIFFLPNLGARKAVACLGRTFMGLRFTILTVCLVVGIAYVMNYSGMSTTLGLALAGTGALFPFFSPLLGWLGVLVSGSDTSSNALFCSLQRTTAERLGLPSGLMVAANASGGVAGKMISPQSIAVATASARLGAREGSLFRSTVGHSIAMALLISAITLIQAYLLPGTVPR